MNESIESDEGCYYSIYWSKHKTNENERGSQIRWLGAHGGAKFVRQLVSYLRGRCERGRSPSFHPSFGVCCFVLLERGLLPCLLGCLLGCLLACCVTLRSVSRSSNECDNQFLVVKLSIVE